MAEKRPPIAKRPVVPRKSSHSPAASPQPCSKPQNNSDDSDDEDEYGYIQPESQSGDLANLIREAGRLPICVKVRSDPEIKNADCKGGDILMVHCTDKEQVVKALGPTGNTLYLPVHSNQLYQMLPLDPRLDGKEYRGTMELVKANPLPQVVRVLIGYCDETDEDDTKEQDDIITIEGVNKGRNDELYVVGKIMGEAQRIRGMEDEAVYTTQIISEHLSLSQVIKHKLPVRVRTVSTGSPSRRRPTELELRLDCLIKRERVIATRARDGAVLAFPFSTPLELDGITPPWNIIPSLVTPLYPLVNTSMCMKGLSSVTLPYTAMKAVPQPKKAVLDEWLKSQEAKLLINEIAEQENVEMQKKIASLMADLKRAESELNHFKSQCSPLPYMAPSLPVRPPRSPGHIPSTSPSHLPVSPIDCPSGAPLGLEPPVPSRPSFSIRSNSQEEKVGDYDVVQPKSSNRTSIGLASTDLEKELKNLLAEKVLEIQTKDKENRSLQEQNKILQSKLDKQTKKLSEIDQTLEALRDEEDCYDLMVPGHKNTSKHSHGKEHHILPKRPPTETTLKKTSTLRPPNIPLPSVPASPGISTLPRGTEHKDPRAEYDPLPISMRADKENPSLRPRLKSPTKISSPVRRVPLPTEPLQPHPSLKSSDLMSLPLSQQTDSFKRSMTARPSHPHSISPGGQFAFTSAPVSEYDLPDLAPPLPPLPEPRNVPVTQSSKISEYDLPYNEVPPPPAKFRAQKSSVSPLSPNHSFNPVMYATPDTNLNTFTKENVAVLLKSLNLDNCVSRFLEESVDGVLLMSIDEEMMMKELGMTRFQARKLTIKIDELTTR